MSNHLPLRLGLIFVMSLGLLSCTSRVTPIPCHRFEAGYLGPESKFRLNVPMDEIPHLDAAPDRLILALSLMPRSDGSNDEATLVHSIDGREVDRWRLKLPPPRGISLRCSIASTENESNCGAWLSGLPTKPGGLYRLYSNHDRLIEAGLSFYVCQ